MKTALITGGLGFIGAQIARRLLEDNVVERVVLLDHYGAYISPLRSGHADYRRVRLVGIEDRVVVERGQVHYATVIDRVLRRHRPNIVFHLAALPLASLENLNVQEALEGTVISTGYLFESLAAMRDEGHVVDRIVYCSSSMTYGTFKYTPADEDHPKEPIEIYGTAKLAGEITTRGLARRFGLPATIVRPSAVYGPTDMNQRVTQIFLERALLGKKLTVQGENEALDFTYIRDIAKGFILAATKPEGIGETFNITSGHAHTLLEYVQALAKHIPDIQYEIVPRDGTRPQRGTLSIDKAARLLGYAPDYDLQSGVAEYVAFKREHWLPTQSAASDAAPRG
ncbi:MAG: NAD-dependent epimerase/dehydratase family protein [Myxococcales bacterium]|nr:NAD-dependent epimerase/dehydratase family protein [Myxococcales bacterium]